MATISTLVEKNGGNGVIIFTAPFDCIIGIELIEGTSGNIARNYKFANTAPYIIAGAIAPGMKISCIIMRSGESITLTGNIRGYITGVSA